MNKRTCNLPGCDKDSRAKGLCINHYRSMRRATLKLDPPKIDWDAMRKALAEKSTKQGDCIIWTGTTSEYGYGMIQSNRHGYTVHRISWELENGPIPEGLLIDHMCFNKRCINPGHLRPVTVKQNGENRRGAQVNSSSGIRGVYMHKRTGTWEASVTHEGKRYYAGYHANIDDAERAVIAKRLELFTHNIVDRQPV